tara:strand:+ start:2771 stop:3637 length:867 start_codon:yes stop_codon:yes gene_type:complete
MSRKRNENRINSVTDAPTPPPNVLEGSTESKDSMFSFVMPTEIVDLPSRGTFYPENHPLHGKSTVEIKYMTAKEEDILTSKTLVNKGIVLDRLLSSIIMDKNVNPDDLLVGDKNALLVAARTTGYGSRYEAAVNCPNCAASFTHAFELDEIEVNEEPDFEELGVTLDNGLFFFELPTSKVTVGIQLLTGKEEKELARVAEKKKKYNLPEATLTDLLKTIIVSANGSEDKALISQFVDVMPARDSRALRTTYTNISPDVDLTQDITCPECGTGSVVEVPFTGDFFWPRS